MMELGMLHKNFPMPGCALITNPTTVSSLDDNGAINSVDQSNPLDPTTEAHLCECPKRQEVPSRPSQLPFPCKPENNAKMKEWLLQRYSGSTFNTCPHQHIPEMSGPPLEIHVNEDARPYARHKAAPIPVHWEKEVHDGLLRDEALGIIERVPYGEPVTWCHRMVISRKHDGSPRRTVDLSPLNKFCKRETHNSESPFHVARRVPAHTWKTVTDAWNGYHLVPLKDTDRYLTTFTTPFGLWRYKRGIQGYVSSGDAFNRRFDAILSDFERKERVVDDTLHYDLDLATHWWRTIDFLTTTGKSGIVLNPSKFQFAGRTVDFAGFRISEDRIEPLPKYFNAIRNFPTPSSPTDIKSWFGLVNQVAHYAQLRDIMAPFRPFLSEKKHPFTWNDELDKAFRESKNALVDAIKHGISIFDPLRKTCLRTDWSKKGIGYYLLQKHCDCSSDLPDCCDYGWHITLAGSRFLQTAEERYAPVEGEALAVAWALEQTRFFTQGCDDLMVVTDHKPLTKLLGDRTLDEIQNTRLFRLKQRTLPWYFRILHMPGKSNSAADAMSRYPTPTDSTSSLEHGDHQESALLASIKTDTSVNFAIPWSTISRKTLQDDTLHTIMTYVDHGFPENLPDHPKTLKPYWKYKDAFYITDGVLMYNDRIVVPSSLRQQVLSTLHAAHQGVSSMEARARSTVFWPGLTHDIDATRATCRECTKIAPSQPHLPPAPYDPPTTPFEKIAADFFHFGGWYYLVVADRLSGWPEAFKCNQGSSRSGADGLVSCLRQCFAIIGVPTEISSNGGPEFTAHRTAEFLKKWDVHHRLSSSYHPQSNGRAEVAVKTMKRLLRSNTSSDGSLNNDNFLRAILQLRNTPDPDCDLSPSQIVFGKPLRDAFSFLNRLDKFTNPHILPTWR